MGQGPSIPSVGRRSSIRSSWRSPFTARRSRTHQEPLSATYNFVDSDLKMEQLNINLATEEELMTLPGISRSVAQGIVEYRQAIGRFNKVEDLALVSGIGAHKLDLIRPEICVSRKKNNCSSPSSRAQSFDSLPSNGSGKTPGSNAEGVPLMSGMTAVPPSPASSGTRPPSPVDINTASVFELMSVRGLNQELAANIVAHRERRGPYCSVDDLGRVKGLNLWRLNAMRSQLVVKVPPGDMMSDGIRNSTVPTGIGRNDTWRIKKPKAGFNSACDSHRLGHRKTSSAPIKYSFTLANGIDLSQNGGGAIGVDDPWNSDHIECGDPLWDLFELLSLHSERPIVEDMDDMASEGGIVLRLASWNLDHFSRDKAENPGVREVLCRTVLENRFTVIAIQEVIEEAALKKVCDELNRPILRRVAEWKHNSRAWKYAVFRSSKKSSVSLGFLYDSGREVELTGASESRHMDQKNRSRSVPQIEAVMAVFKVRLSTFSIWNVYCNPCAEVNNGMKHNGRGCYISEHELALQHQLKFKESQADALCPHVILGDFSGIVVKDGKTLLQNIGNGFTNVAPIGTVTDSEESGGGQRTMKQFHDNIFLDPEAKQCYTGQWGVVRRGLTHLAIPKGWAWGGPVSSHCPLWCRMVLDGKEEIDLNPAVPAVQDKPIKSEDIKT